MYFLKRHRSAEFFMAHLHHLQRRLECRVWIEDVGTMDWNFFYKSIGFFCIFIFTTYFLNFRITIFIRFFVKMQLHKSDLFALGKGSNQIWDWYSTTLESMQDIDFGFKNFDFFISLNQKWHGSLQNQQTHFTKKILSKKSAEFFWNKFCLKVLNCAHFLSALNNCSKIWNKVKVHSKFLGLNAQLKNQFLNVQSYITWKQAKSRNVMTVNAE